MNTSQVAKHSDPAPHCKAPVHGTLIVIRYQRRLSLSTASCHSAMAMAMAMAILTKLHCARYDQAFLSICDKDN